jgi:hypothetical protein
MWQRERRGDSPEQLCSGGGSVGPEVVAGKPAKRSGSSPSPPALPTVRPRSPHYTARSPARATATRLPTPDDVTRKRPATVSGCHMYIVDGPGEYRDPPGPELGTFRLERDPEVPEQRLPDRSLHLVWRDRPGHAAHQFQSAAGSAELPVRPARHSHSGDSRRRSRRMRLLHRAGSRPLRRH